MYVFSIHLIRYFDRAPSSFIGTRYLDFDFHLPNSDILRKRDGKELHVRFPGFILTGTAAPKSATEQFHFQDPAGSNEIYHLTPEDAGIRLYPYTPRKVYQKEFARWAAFDRAVYETKALGVIWRNQGDCVLVSVSGNLLQDGNNEVEIWGSFLCGGFLRLLKLDVRMN